MRFKGLDHGAIGDGIEIIRTACVATTRLRRYLDRKPILVG
jgi:hypothetical protein